MRWVGTHSPTATPSAYEALSALLALIRNAQFHQGENAALAGALGRLEHALRPFLAEGQVSIQVREGQVLLNGARVRFHLGYHDTLQGVLDLFQRLGMGTLTLTLPLHRETLLRWAQWVATVPGEGSGAFDRLRKWLEHNALPGIHVDPPAPEVEGSPEDPVVRARQIYFRTLRVVEEVMESTKFRPTLELRRVRRVVQSLVDLILHEETTLLGLTTLRSYDEYTYHHSVNVCILSLAMGQRLGYTREELCALGMATLFHDIGKVMLPWDLLNKPTEFTPQEWDVIRKHPVYGVKTLLQLRGLHEQIAWMMLVSFEHHRHLDLSGYPSYPEPRRISLFGRVATIADCYDAMTSARVYRRTPLVPDQALQYMLERAGTVFDPILLKVFVNTVGIYPIGTLVLLNTGELALTVGVSRDPSQVHRPRIRVLCDPAGNPVPPRDVELGQDPSRSIVQALDARRYGIEVSSYFLGYPANP